MHCLPSIKVYPFSVQEEIDLAMEKTASVYGNELLICVSRKSRSMMINIQYSLFEQFTHRVRLTE